MKRVAIMERKVSSSQRYGTCLSLVNQISMLMITILLPSYLIVMMKRYLEHYVLISSKAYILQGSHWGSSWQLRPTQVKCTCNANGSTYILHGFLIKISYIWRPYS